MRRKPLAVVFCGLLALSAAACGHEKELNDLAGRVEEHKALGLTDVLVAEVPVPERTAVAEKLSGILDRTYVVPGVEQAAVVDVLPGGAVQRHQVQVQQEGMAAGRPSTAFVQAVSPDYFRVLKLDLILGRSFSPSDSASNSLVAIVNEGFARQRSQDSSGNLLGHRIKIGTASAPLLTIVGVVKNGSGTQLTPEVYIPYSQQGMAGLPTFASADTPAWYLLVRVKGDPKDAAVQLQQALGWKFQTMEERLRTHL